MGEESRGDLSRSTLEAYVSILIAIVLAIMPMTWWLRIVLLLIAISILTDLVLRLPRLRNTHIMLRGAIIVLLAAVLILWATPSILKDYKGEEKPEIIPYFYSSKEPGIILRNVSNVTAINVIWQVALFNLDNIRIYSNAAPDDPKMALEPLPIPGRDEAYIGPKLDSPLFDLFNNVRPFVKPGDHLIGSAGVSCENCGRGHTVVVYIEFGKGGWYSELSDIHTGKIMIPHRFVKPFLYDYYHKIIELVPEDKRIPITDWPS